MLRKSQVQTQKALDKLATHVKSLDAKRTVERSSTHPAQTNMSMSFGNELSNNNSFIPSYRNALEKNLSDSKGGSSQSGPSGRGLLPQLQHSHEPPWTSQIDNEFQMQRHERLQQLRKVKRNQKAVVGTSTKSSTFKSGRKTLDFLVFRVHNDVSLAEI